MSEIDDEDDKEYEQMLKKHKQRLEQAAKKYAIELDTNKEKAKEQESSASKSNKYDNPFERNTKEEDEDFNDRDLDFNTDAIGIKTVKKPTKNKIKQEMDSDEKPSSSKTKEVKVTFEDDRIDTLTDTFKSDIKTKSAEQPPWVTEFDQTDRKPMLYTEEDEQLDKKIRELLNSDNSESREREDSDNCAQPELSYEDILRKYKNLTHELDDLNSDQPTQQENGIEKEELEKSIKLAEDEILKYKSRLERSLKDDEDSQAFRKSFESDRFKSYLAGNYLEKELTEPDLHRYAHHDTLEYSPTSRKESEMKGYMETENDMSYRSFDESFKKIENIIKSSPRVNDSRQRETKSPLSSRRSSDQRNKMKESPRTVNQRLGSPADNKNIVYDKFININKEKPPKEVLGDESEAIDFIKAKHQNLKAIVSNKNQNQVSPLRRKNLAENDISKLSTVHEENISKELTPAKVIRTVDDKMSPMRIPDLQQRIEHFSPVPFSQRNKSPVFSNRQDSSRKNVLQSPGMKEEDVLPKFEDFQSMMKDVDEVTAHKPKQTPDDTQEQRRYDKEYQSIQETLRSIKDIQMSPAGGKANYKIRRSDQEMDLDYSITSVNFSRDENPLEDQFDVFNSVEKYGADDTISMLTYKTPERDTMRSSWKRSSEANAFLMFKDKSILELLSVYEKAKAIKHKSGEVEESIHKIDYLFNRLRYCNRLKKTAA